ncbi:lytic transglycosylase domain-containing protein [Neoasaia chiangmaiensis]|uniref:Murein transglycosylase n=1 Tax=Neoasaia chiangmaiensis TaxID=320497 RepID=A0A1U9KSW1_9PROT|nr:lytic transglycosylase domain-containing protein [Neoasaia chiangmaiensis]AQS88875.1 hypothetical protein A0U93_14185 [Neoasaia chiangmaiensis]
MSGQFHLFRSLSRALALASTGLLCACSTTSNSPYNRYNNGAYRAPGPATDPWGPYIREAASRFSIPHQWIRAVIQQESGGHQYLNGQPTTSDAGAMGLMQLMPETYADMQAQFSLGSDPYEPHDNIMAGTGYLRILYQKYGAPGFLAAYNAGPRRLDDYLETGRELPNETINYIASVTPHLGNQIALSGPLAAYAGPDQQGGGGTGAVIEVAEAPSEPTSGPASGTQCIQDPNAAYDPDMPCSLPVSTPPPPPAPIVTQAAASSALPPPSPTACDPDAAYDTQVSCSVVPGVIDASSTSSAPPPHIVRAAYRPPTTPTAATAYGPYAIQVGAFSESGQARFAATMAKQADYETLRGTQLVLQQAPALGRGIFWRARLAGLSHSAAASACQTLQNQGMACMLVPPGH